MTSASIGVNPVVAGKSVHQPETEAKVQAAGTKPDSTKPAAVQTVGSTSSTSSSNGLSVSKGVEGKRSWVDEEPGEECRTIYEAEVTFETLNLPPQLYQNVLCELKFTRPSRVQAASLPIMLSAAHPHFIGQAQAGCGKTAAYALAVLTRVVAQIKVPQAICLVPTRELANQVFGVMEKLAKNTGITVKKAVPDEPKGLVTDQVVVGTPGTIKAKLMYREIDGSQIIVFVCDEADQMLARQGLGDQTLAIKSKCTNPALQVLLFSATFPPTVEKFAHAIAPNARSVRIKKEEVSLQNVKQFWAEAGDASDKYKKLVLLYGLMQLGQSLIFTESIKSAKDLCNKMRADGYTVSLLYGKDLSPAERDAIMKDFITGKTTVLIATNVIARGIDVPTINLVVNYELPVRRSSRGPIPDYETYCHRVGRAGRFGRTGAAISFVSGMDEKRQLAEIAKFFDYPVLELKFDDFENLEKTIRTALAAPPPTATSSQST